MKLRRFLANLRAGVYHNGKIVDGKYIPDDGPGPKKCVYIMHVIEYQQRGLPHAHIVMRHHLEQVNTIIIISTYITLFTHNLLTPSFLPSFLIFNGYN